MNLPTLDHPDMDIHSIWVEYTCRLPELCSIIYYVEPSHFRYTVAHDLHAGYAVNLVMELRKRIRAVRRLMGRDVSSLVVT